MTEQTLQEDLMVVFVANSDGMFNGIKAQTLEKIGVAKKGLFLTMSDGTEFSITIKINNGLRSSFTPADVSGRV